jgi:N-acetylglucosaminyl-diphospho-decaprenol L-rhamnosyltransferase
MTLSTPLPKHPIELVAVVNSFNRRKLLEQAIASLAQALRETLFGSAIVVFEAGSDDGSREFLKTWADNNPMDNLVIITPSENRASFSDGVNAGCATALARFPQCRWLFFFETDNWLKNARSLEQAIALFKSDPRMGAIGFTVKQHDGSFCGYGMRFPSILSLVLGRNLASQWNLDRPNQTPWQTSSDIRWRKCDVVFTSPLLIRRETWEQTGGFDADAFPFSDSDLDWAWRCAKLGWKTAVIESENVVHDNLEQPSAWSANRALDFQRNRLRLLKRHRGVRAALIRPLLFLRHCAETIFLLGKLRFDPGAKQKLAQRLRMLRSVWRDYSQR